MQILARLARPARPVPAAPLQGLPRLPWLWGAAGAIGLLGAMVLGVLVGPAHIGLGTVVQALVAPSAVDPGQASILWSLRIPRVLLGAIVGAMLAAAGAAYQGAFRNPLADPYLLGAGAGGNVGR